MTLAAGHVPGTGSFLQQDLGSYTNRVVAIPPQSQTGNPGGAEIDGAATNRIDPAVALGAVVAIAGRFTLASGHSCTVKRRIHHSKDAGVADPWATYYGDAAGDPDGGEVADVTVTALNSGAAQDVDLGFGIDLSAAKAYIRAALIPAFSVSGTDTLVVGGEFVFGGYDTNPFGDAFGVAGLSTDTPIS